VTADFNNKNNIPTSARHVLGLLKPGGHGTVVFVGCFDDSMFRHICPEQYKIASRNGGMSKQRANFVFTTTHESKIIYTFAYYTKQYNTI